MGCSVRRGSARCGGGRGVHQPERGCATAPIAASWVGAGAVGQFREGPGGPTVLGVDLGDSSTVSVKKPQPQRGGRVPLVGDTVGEGAEPTTDLLHGQPAVLATQLGQFLAFVAAQTLSLASVDLGLHDPVP